MDFDYAHYMLTERRKGKENPALSSPSRDAYRKKLNDAFNMKRTRILAFKNKPATIVKPIPQEVSPCHHSKLTKPRRNIPQVPLTCSLIHFLFLFLIPRFYLTSYFVITWQTSERTLDAPDLLDDFYLNLLDWGRANVLAIALGNTVYLWDASDSSTSELVTIDDVNGPVTSVSWAPDGQHLAVGLTNSEVQLWDSTATRQVCLYMPLLHLFLP